MQIQIQNILPFFFTIYEAVSPQTFLFGRLTSQDQCIKEYLKYCCQTSVGDNVIPVPPETHPLFMPVQPVSDCGFRGDAVAHELCLDRTVNTLQIVRLAAPLPSAECWNSAALSRREVFTFVSYHKISSLRERSHRNEAHSPNVLSQSF